MFKYSIHTDPHSRIIMLCVTGVFSFLFFTPLVGSLTQSSTLRIVKNELIPPNATMEEERDLLPHTSYYGEMFPDY